MIFELIKKCIFWAKNGLIIAVWKLENLPLSRLMYFSTETENLDLLSWCIQCGGDINMQDVSGRSLIHFAVKKRSRKSVGFLLENGADPNHIDEYGLSPLHLSVFYQYESILEELLNQESINPNIESPAYTRPIIYAHQKQNLRMVSALTFRGARTEDALNSVGPTHHEPRMAGG
jgi:ankyrin repeat protein